MPPFFVYELPRLHIVVPPFGNELARLHHSVVFGFVNELAHLHIGLLGFVNELPRFHHIGILGFENELARLHPFLCMSCLVYI